MLKKEEEKNALPVYNRENIHLIDDEQLVFTIDDQLLFEMLLLEIRGKLFHMNHLRRKKTQG